MKNLMPLIFTPLVMVMLLGAGESKAEHQAPDPVTQLKPSEGPDPQPDPANFKPTDEKVIQLKPSEGPDPQPDPANPKPTDEKITQLKASEGPDPQPDPANPKPTDENITQLKADQKPPESMNKIAPAAKTQSRIRQHKKTASHKAK